MRAAIIAVLALASVGTSNILAWKDMDVLACVQRHTKDAFTPVRRVASRVMAHAAPTAQGIALRKKCGG